MKELEQIFRNVFDLPSLTLSELVSIEDLEEWDSLSHFELINEIENFYNIKINSKAINEMRSVKEILKVIDSFK